MADLTRCTCGGENSDGRGDVLECVVHGIGAPAFSHRPEVGAGDVASLAGKPTSEEVAALWTVT
jgi:hypothetical protein